MALAIMLALGVPLQRLLRPPAAVAAPVAAQEERQKVSLHVEFTVPPSEFRVLSLGREVWAAQAPGPEIARELQLPFPKEGIELQFECTWPETVRAAAQVRLTAPDGAEHVKYLWGQGAASDVLAFP